MPRRLLLVGVSHLEHSHLSEGFAGYLQSDGERCVALWGGEATGDTQSWDVGQAVGRGEEPGDAVRFCLAVDDGVGLDLLGDKAGRRLHEDVRLLQGLEHLLAQEAMYLHAADKYHRLTHRPSQG